MPNWIRAAIACLSIASALAGGRAGATPGRWVPVPGKSEATFAATFALGNFSGRTDAVTGEFRGDPTDLRQGVAGYLQVKAATLRTGDGGRDRDMRRVLAVERYPDIRFTLGAVDASFPSLTDRADVVLTVSGVMSIRGVERPMTFPGRARLREDKLWVRGEAELKLSDFGMKPPSRFFLKVGNTLLVAFDLLLAPAP